MSALVALADSRLKFTQGVHLQAVRAHVGRAHNANLYVRRRINRRHLYGVSHGKRFEQDFRKIGVRCDFGSGDVRVLRGGITA